MAEVDHSSRDHALLSASGAKRWLSCTPSARLEEKAVDKSGDSIYAQEGTLAHELSDIELHRKWKPELMPTRTYNAQKKKLRNAVIKLLDENAWKEMVREVAKYTDQVSEKYAEVLKEHPDAILILEERLDYSHVVPQGFGTGDAMIVADGIIFIFDLKYGRGISVEAKSNPQMMLYALGALREQELVYDIERVNMNIIQPRLNNYSSWECSVGYLTKWADTVVRPKAEEAFAGEGEKEAGDWCKFCKVAVFCRKLADHNLELARHDFKAAQDLTLEEMSDIMLRADMLTDWLASIKKHLQKEALAGKTIPMHKLVLGKSNRKWVDEAKVKKLLTEEGFKEDEYLKVSLEGIPKIERLVGKEDFDDKFAGTWEKPQGAPTLVHISDKRQPYGLASAKADFEPEK